jgi:hypothetical protein
LIQSQDEFDAVLEEATHLLETNPSDGSPQSRRLADLVGMLSSYASFLEDTPAHTHAHDHEHAGDAAAEQRAQLIARANKLEREFHATSGPHVYEDLHPGA